MVKPADPCSDWLSVYLNLIGCLRKIRNLFLKFEWLCFLGKSKYSAVQTPMVDTQRLLFSA